MTRTYLLWLVWFSYRINTVFSIRVGPGNLPTPDRRREKLFDCEPLRGAGGAGVCTRCYAGETDAPGVFFARCYECPAGYSMRMVADEPEIEVAAGRYKHFKFMWQSVCVPLIGEERRLIMIRHGESIWNELMERTKKTAGVFGAIYGWDSPLSPLGLRQAQRLSHVLKKASSRVYGRYDAPKNITARDDYLGIVAARAELDHVSLEETLRIEKQPVGTLISDEDMVSNLVREENREELDVLLGRKCSETNFVSSQLARAMDTLLIVTMESRLQCAAPWLISSNLQEIEHNADCTPTATPQHKPEMRKRQKRSYYTNGMGRTQEYVSSRYANSNVSRYLENFGQLERARWRDQSPQMRDELSFMFESPKKFNVWGGHSIWFRHFFQAFADAGSPLCHELQQENKKMANTAMVSLRLRAVDPSVSSMGYAAYDCHWLHLGSSDEFKMTLNEDVLQEVTIPEPADFDNGVQFILGWKCCCSRSDYKDARVWLRTRRSLELCVLVRTEHCSDPSTWVEVLEKGHEDDKIMDRRNDYDWGYNKGPCTANY